MAHQKEKMQMQQMEDYLDSELTELEKMNKQATKLYDDLNNLEGQLQQWINTDVDKYNVNVDKYNSILDEYNHLYNDYEARRTEYNKKVDEYNKLANEVGKKWLILPVPTRSHQ